MAPKSVHSFLGGREIGKTLTDAHLRSQYGITVVGVKSPGKPFTYATEKTVVSNHDLIIVSGTEGDIEKFAALE